MDNNIEPEDQEKLTESSGQPVVDGESESSGQPVVDGESESSGQPVVDGESESSGEPEPRGLFAAWFGSRTRLIALFAGVVFLVVVLYIAISGVSGERGGAEGPEAAVAELVEALNNEDIVAALSVMAPSEVGTLGDMYPKLVELLVETETLQNENWLAGADFEVVGLVTRGRELYPGVALVEIRDGTLSMTIDSAAADPIVAEIWGAEPQITIEELRDRMRELEESPELAESRDAIEGIVGISVDEAFTVRAPRDGVFLMTVKRDGRWYVSPFYTVAEYARQILDLPPADYALSREDAAPAAQSPSGVINDAVDVINSYTLEQHLKALLDGDPDMMFAPFSAFAPYDEFGVFIDYAPSYAALTDSLSGSTESDEQELNEELKELLDSYDLKGQVSVTVDIREEQRRNGDATLNLESGSVRADFSFLSEPGGDDITEVEFEASWEGLCGQFYLSINGESDVSGESGADCLPTDIAPEGFGEVFVVVGEVGGSWYLSYVETILAYLNLFIEDQLAG